MRATLERMSLSSYTEYQALFNHETETSSCMQAVNFLNKPELATMRPDCVSACIDHVTYYGVTDGRTDG